MSSAISRKMHCGVHINVGFDIDVTSPNAYTSQITLMAMLALDVEEDSISSQSHREAFYMVFLTCQTKLERY